MSTRLRGYGLALLSVIVATIFRVILVPVIGYGLGFAFFLIGIFVSGRYGGFGPSVVALLVGAIPAVLVQSSDPTFHWSNLGFQAGLVMYLVLGAIVSFLCKSEQAVRAALHRELAERKTIESELRESKQQLLLAIEAGRLGTWQLDLQTHRVHWSGLMEAMHGFAPGTFGGTLAESISNNHPEDQERILRIIEQPPDADRIAYRVILPDGHIRWIEAVGETLRDESGKPTQIVGVCSDVTEQREFEDAIRSNEARLRGILDNTPAVISLKDLEGRYLLVNRGWEELYGVQNDQIVGLTNEELLTKTLSHHMSREIADQFLKIDRTVIETGEPIEFEDPMQYGDDPRLFVTVKFPIKEAGDRITGIGGISIDITERRKALDSLAAEQELLRHTIELQDQERQLIAYEIHDGLIQYVTGALMQLESMRTHDIAKPAAEAIESVEEILRRAVAEGRHLINGIRTPVLDGFGVVAAVEHLILEEDRAHVQVEFVKDEGLERMEPRIEEAIYRITQEALTNIGKHSQSKSVRVELGRRGDRVHLEVRDWGVGFTPSNRSKGIHGLRGMTERARIVGGMCKIESSPGEGTRVVVDLPYLSKN